MRMPHHSLPILALLSALHFAAAPARADSDTPQTAAEQREAREALAHNMATTTLAILQDQKKDYADRQEVLERGFSNVVDIDWIAKFVLGKAWKTATDEQRAHYSELYRKYLTKAYVSNFGQSNDKKIRDMRVLGVNDGTDDHFTARTEVMLTTGEDMKVDYLVNDNHGKYKIIDIVIEGVSLLATHRAEFSTLASKSGVTGVIAKLEQLVAPAKPTLSFSMN